MTESRSVARFRAVLAELDPRISLAARLRAIFPQLEELAASGLPMAAILSDLSAAGLDVQPDTLTKTLYRWRKRKRGAMPVPAPANPAPPAPDRETPHKTQRIETPGDLRNIRNMHVDLEALRREGQALRKGK
ncbi:hypothetical protein [Castellaniella denitrificans]|uniref:Transposase n=1 Tax=Castellaniella denitrificans TaxID=56119 RepID=A0ABT4M0A1_9BURK|nr:hypothetical protein [Castellaniella denitrificans]MCZ4328499.1 hypothetical protein [Castellaniella denitrificans]